MVDICQTRSQQFQAIVLNTEVRDVRMMNMKSAHSHTCKAGNNDDDCPAVRAKNGKRTPSKHTNPGRGGSSLNRWTSHNSSELERGTVPRQTRAVLAQATDMRSSRQAETLRATADGPTLLGSDGRPEGSTVRRPEGVSVLASQ